MFKTARLTKQILAAAVIGFSMSPILQAEEMTISYVTAGNAAEVTGPGPGITQQTIVLSANTPGAYTAATTPTPNGQLINSPGTGVGGVDESVVRAPLGIWGFGHQVEFNNRIADDFTLNQPTFIESIDFYAYQTGSPTTSTITAVNLRIWDGVPAAPDSNVVFGDTATNRMTATEWMPAYRVLESASGVATDRPIMVNTVAVDAFLQPGTYWLDWQTDGSLPSGPWAPPISINGEVETGNALQSIQGGPYVIVADVGDPQGFPFVIHTTEYSESNPVPATPLWGLLALIAILGLVGKRRFQGRKS